MNISEVRKLKQVLNEKARLMNVSIKASFEFEQTIPLIGMMIDIMWIASKRNLYDLANFESDSIRKDR